MKLPHDPSEIAFGPLRIWIHGREFPEQDDAWDANWLRITAHCAEGGGGVAIGGAVLDTVSFFQWRSQLRTLYEELRGTATLSADGPTSAS